MFRIEHPLHPGKIVITVNIVDKKFVITESRVDGRPFNPAAAHELTAMMIRAVYGDINVKRVCHNDLLPFLMILAYCGHHVAFDQLLLRHSIYANVDAFASWADEKKLFGYTSANLHKYSTTQQFGNMNVHITLLSYRGLYWHNATMTASGCVSVKDRQYALNFIEIIAVYMNRHSPLVGFASVLDSIYACVCAFIGDIASLKTFQSQNIIDAHTAAFDQATIEYIESVRAAVSAVSAVSEAFAPTPTPAFSFDAPAASAVSEAFVQTHTPAFSFDAPAASAHASAQAPEPTQKKARTATSATASATTSATTSAVTNANTVHIG